MKKQLAIIGFGTLVGAGAYVIWKKYNSKKKKIGACEKKEYPNYATSMARDITVEEETDYIKEAAAETVYARHEEAVQVMKESAEKISKRCEDSDELEALSSQIREELDELLNDL